MRLGSICTGIGGLDLAVESHFGAELAWCAEIDPAASRVLDARFPHAPNIGNFIGRSPEPVDVLCGGFPCQPVSLAGRRAGTDDDRWLFDDICDLVGRMDPRPGVLVFENVLGLLSANGGDAMARVVEGLAALGYVGRYGTVRASDIGAPHRRERVFIVARHADSARTGTLATPGASRHPARQPDRCSTADTDTLGRERGGQARGRGCGSSHGRFGPYAPAVERWELILGRPAPCPVDDAGRLDPEFVTWMMGFPAGWVTDVLDRRTDALRCLGNAVVPQQAAHALASLMPHPHAMSGNLTPTPENVEAPRAARTAGGREPSWSQQRDEARMKGLD